MAHQQSRLTVRRRRHAGFGSLAHAWSSSRVLKREPGSGVLEILVHFEIDVRDLPTRYRLLKLHAPDTLIVEDVATADLPTDWLERTDLTRATGDRWLQAGPSPLLRVPSAVVPETFNVLLNPGHEHAGQVGVVQTSEHAIDPRLLT